MCGRFAVWMQNLEDEIAARYPYIEPRPYQPPEEEGGEENQPEFYPRYNIAPRSMSPIIRRVEVDNHPGNVLQLMKWGVIPHWQKTESSNLATINARSEAIIDGESQLWNSLTGKRCVVPVNGYFEWIKKGNKRIPYYMKHKDDRPILFAGLWESTTLEGNKYPTYTFTIITTSSSKQLSFIHDRMPVILTTQEDIERWLDPAIPWNKDLTDLLHPFEDQMEVYQVPPEVGKVGTNDPSFVKPVSERKDGIEAMFKKQQDTKSGSPSKSQSTSLGAGSPSQSQPISSSQSPKPEKEKQQTVSASERMTLGDAQRALKRSGSELSEEQVAEVSDEDNVRLKKRPRQEKTPIPSPQKIASASNARTPKKPPSSPAKKSKLPPQKAKITDFFAK